jgi:hypothetical protein
MSPGSITQGPAINANGRVVPISTDPTLTGLGGSIHGSSLELSVQCSVLGRSPPRGFNGQLLAKGEVTRFNPTRFEALQELHSFN